MEPTILDPKAITRLKSMLGMKTAEMLPKLIEELRQQATALIEQAPQMIEQGKNDELRRATHTLKSNALNFGANVLAGLCQEAENLAKAGQLTDLAGYPARIEAEWQKIHPALANLQEQKE